MRRSLALVVMASMTARRVALVVGELAEVAEAGGRGGGGGGAVGTGWAWEGGGLGTGGTGEDRVEETRPEAPWCRKGGAAAPERDRRPQVQPRSHGFKRRAEALAESSGGLSTDSVRPD